MSATAALEAARRVLRATPNVVPGKLRVTRAAIAAFYGDEPICLPDRFGNQLWCANLREPIAASLFSNGVYEPETIAVIASKLPRDGVFLDVGANIGAITLAVASTRPQARIVCVEADPDIASTLRRNLAQNRRTAVTVVECVAGDLESTIPFYRAPSDYFGMGSVGPQFDATPVGLPQRRLDDILDDLNISHPDVVKLDIEGSELAALRGLSRRLKSARPPAVIFEFSDWAEARIAGQSPGDAQRFLSSLGYRLFSASVRKRAVELDGAVTRGSRMILALPGHA